MAVVGIGKYETQITMKMEHKEFLIIVSFLFTLGMFATCAKTLILRFSQIGIPDIQKISIVLLLSPLPFFISVTYASITERTKR